MIGVISKPADREVVEEFFQLFKTPWQFFEPSHRYDVVLAAGEPPSVSGAALTLVYSSRKLPSDDGDGPIQSPTSAETVACWGDVELPLYGKSCTFGRSDGVPVLLNKAGATLGYVRTIDRQWTLRIGFDLFDEVRFLLKKGQPPQNALFPTLDRHIAMLRGFIAAAGLPFVEIPPVPAGYKFIACLTHDVDFVSIRDHLIDHSFLGFLYRATLGGAIDLIRRKTSFYKLTENLQAVLALPLIFTKGYKDPWNQFTRYLKLEQGAPSTFFFIPYKNRSGEGFQGEKKKYRAAKYDVDDVKDTIRMLIANGCEAGVHGIDSWHSAEKARLERERISQVTASAKVGIRMHWLCMNEDTFGLLDQAGYDYDSTVGFNEVVGFRAGTAQVYKPIGSRRLLELPLHVQDSALFNPGRMNLAPKHAEQLCSVILSHCAGQNGGVFTVLWHQRSIGPERLWGDFYSFLLKKLSDLNGWFATAADAVDWYRVRRSARFMHNGEVNVPLHIENDSSFPKLTLRTYAGSAPGRPFGLEKPLVFSDKPINFEIIK